jgi:hypothetical protein
MEKAYVSRRFIGQVQGRDLVFENPVLYPDTALLPDFGSNRLQQAIPIWLFCQREVESVVRSCTANILISECDETNEFCSEKSQSSAFE